MSDSCLVTGAEGFIGSHLCDFLVERGLTVHATTLGETENIKHLGKKIHLTKCDLTDRESTEKLVSESSARLVFHLAAQSFPTVSWAQPGLTLKSNIQGTFNLLNELRKSKTDPTVVVVGSSAVYGATSPDEIPLKEDREFRPTSVYAVSKVAEEMLAYFHWRVYGMKIVRVRPFNMTGPRKTDDACSDFTKEVAEIKLGRRRMLEVGNLNAVRDFTDGRDAVRALWLLANSGKHGEVYNLCSGQGIHINEVIDLLRRHASFEVTVDSSRMRPFDDPIYVGDASKLRALGWKPEIPLERTLSDLVEYWVQRFSAPA
jgi:GDP-4-dehydro-6-deoxy-D-mannose reductase